MSCIQCKKGFGSTCYPDHEGFKDHLVEEAARLIREDGSPFIHLKDIKPMDPDRFAMRLQEAFKGMEAPASDMADAMSYAGKAMRGFGPKVRKKSGS